LSYPEGRKDIHLQISMTGTGNTGQKTVSSNETGLHFRLFSAAQKKFYMKIRLPYNLINRKRLDALQNAFEKAVRLETEAILASDFIRKIEKGDLEATYEGTENTNDQTLGGTLLSMREQMKNLAAQEHERTWTTEGLARFVETLRAHHEESQRLYQNIISQLVKYLKANQGGLFVVNNTQPGQPVLELMACYAYERLKFTQKIILPGEGLVGQCYLEADTIFLTDVPQKYLHITSGLGEATPRCLLIVPLKLNDTIYGVIELASFQVLAPYQIQFIEKLGESIAATISTAQVNEKTRYLLQESQMQGEMLRAQEEEMRQNLEELAATQEEMQRRELETQSLLAAVQSVNASMATVDLDADGRVLTANANFLQLTGYTLAELEGKSQSVFLSSEMFDSEHFIESWRNLLHGFSQTDDYLWKGKNGTAIWVRATYAPVKNALGEVQKVIKFAQDVTDRKKQEFSFQRLSLVADNTNNSVIITDKNGLVEYVNRGFERMTGHTLDEMLGKKPGAVLQGADTNPATIRRIREKLAAREPFYEEILNYDKKGQSYWISLAINPVFDAKGELDKFIAIQANVTETKLQALDFNSKLIAIEKSYGMVEFDTEGHLLSANDIFLELMGYTLAEVQGKHHRMFMPEGEGELPEYRQFWHVLGKEGKFTTGEFRRVDKNGQAVWLRGSYNAILDLQGRPYKVVKYAQDITRQKAIEQENAQQMEELQTQEEEMRQTMEEMTTIQEEMERTHIEMNGLAAAINLTLATVEFDMQGNILSANQNFLQVMGYELDELLHRHHRLFLEKEYAESQAYVHFWEELNAGKPQSGEVKRATKNGQTVWLNASYTPVFDQEGRPFKVIKFAQDITAQKKTTLDAQSQLNAINKSYLVAEFDREGNLLDANENFLKAMEYELLEITGKHHHVFVLPQEVKTEEYERFWERLRNGESISGEFERVTKSGRKLWIKGNYNAILDAEGKPYKVVKFALDITRDKSAVKQNHKVSLV
jgi:PAS domain S-box-containing protein